MQIKIPMDHVKKNRYHEAIDDPNDYLVVGDEKKKATWHLPVSRDGVIDRRLLGAAHAALVHNFRGNTYDGPNKKEALAKLLKLYRREGIEVPS